MTGDKDFDGTLERCLEILDMKGQDYTVGSKDRLANFNRGAELLGLRPEQVLAIYWYKHVTAVLNYIKTGGQSESEPIEGRITDCINYLLLFSKMVAEKKRAAVARLTSVEKPEHGPGGTGIDGPCDPGRKKCKTDPIAVNDERLCLKCFSDVGQAETAGRFTPTKKSLACVSCPARRGAEEVWVDSSGQCIECFAGDKRAWSANCVKCGKSALVNAAGYCRGCAMKPDPKWLRANVDKP